MEAVGFETIGTFRAPARAVWFTALVLLSGCVNTADLTPAGQPPPRHGPPAQAS